MLRPARPSYILESTFCHGGFVGGGPGGGGSITPFAGWVADGYRGGGGGMAIMLPRGCRMGGDMGGGGGGTWKGRDGSLWPF